MNADAHYSIGRSHTICQDVARSGRLDDSGVPYAIVCDGCSSSPQTEFGAQIVAQMAVQEMAIFRAVHSDDDIVRDHFINGMVRASMLRSSVVAHECRLPMQALDVTLLFACVVGGVAHLSLSGDGSAFWRERGGGGRMCLVTVDFTAGAPAYPSYGLSAKRNESYCELTRNGARTVSTYYSDGGGFVLTDVVEYQGMAPLVIQLPISDVDLVAIASDGLSSFQRRTGGVFEAVPVTSVAERVFAFKNFTGAFVTRRLRRFLTSEAPSLGWHNDDDLSIGAINIPESK